MAVADYAVQYNGDLLTEAVPNAQVTSIVVQPIPIEYTKLDSANRNGSLLVRRKLASRRITITVELPLEPGVGEYASNARLLRKWAEAPTDRPLILPDYPGKYLSCVLTSMTPITIEQWYKPIELEFTAFSDPYFQDQEISVGSVNSKILIDGDVAVDPVIQHTIIATLTDPVWELAAGYKIILSGTFTAGTITIDTQHGYVSMNDSSLMTALDPSSRFCSLEPGVHTIKGPDGGRITWTERWVD